MGKEGEPFSGGRNSPHKGAGTGKWLGQREQGRVTPGLTFCLYKNRSGNAS